MTFWITQAIGWVFWGIGMEQSNKPDLWFSLGLFTAAFVDWVVGIRKDSRS